MTLDINIELALDSSAEEVAQDCMDLSELLHFYLHAGKTVGFLRNLICERGFEQDPEELYSLISVLDDAMNSERIAQTNQAINIAEKLSGAFLRTTLQQEDPARDT